ncbi:MULTISPECIES: 3-hydroxyacyl-CoA dehydrogenase NAD-binding domain-containing protein [unclassified Brevibacterium]|uniref:3-hydroxyacyl-CoA dehydrogenase NAD-binding domain-containing protein n=1 Tax=unclassified Brevibacterium TaxID=2614124 RepID=UPI0010926F23|nr:3-hydroxyacyl-CoA dehydrogenase NAD-binding domain-containing protein [Brevibacterium sp. S22]TGD32618.1 3-hydroxyacyl-CoA dehydrogenase [Brevibacterium sp. S22]
MTKNDTTQRALRIDHRNGIAVLTFDQPNASANTMNESYLEGMDWALSEIVAKHDAGELRGVILTSAKKTFFAGGDLDMIAQTDPDHIDDTFTFVSRIKDQLRQLETIGVPVVAAINGAALGGGLEIALAAHHRIAVDDRSVKIGFPEVGFGLLPGGGGVTRTVRLLGVQPALRDWLIEGQQRSAADAKDKGLVDELVTDAESLLPAAETWIDGNPDASAPWDREGWLLPGGSPSNPKVAASYSPLTSFLHKKLKGAHHPAPRAILSAAVEGTYVDFAAASKIESRWFLTLVSSPTAKKMIQAFFFDLQTVSSDKLRPTDLPRQQVTKVGVLGAGMMGAGIAHACASRGIGVVLKDVNLDNAQKGRKQVEALLSKSVGRGRLTEESAAEVLGRIHPSTENSDLSECEAVIEAVFEDADLKGRVFAEAEAALPDSALLCSNTSSLPITDLARSVDRPEDFIGMHFFSPVDRMKLVELIVGEKTSDEALARAMDLVKQMGKVPIVVNDSRGFYTSRVFLSYVLEGAAMVAEGIAPSSIERASHQAGFPGTPLSILDEVTLSLPIHANDEAKRAAAEAGREMTEPHGISMLEAMVNVHGRTGRSGGGGFYDYPSDGTKRFWPGLYEYFTKPELDVPIESLKERLTFAMAVDTARCFEEGVITSAAGANVGSILGIGFPPNEGGVIQFMEKYEGGLPGFVSRARELARLYGERFEPPQWLADRAESGEGVTQ